MTHDIADNPTPYGSTPAMLERAIEKTLAAGIKILTVKNALALACRGQHDSILATEGGGENFYC